MPYHISITYGTANTGIMARYWRLIVGRTSSQRKDIIQIHFSSECSVGMEIVGKGVTLAFLFTSYFILPLNEAVGNIMPGRGNVAIALAYLEAALSQVP